MSKELTFEQRTKKYAYNKQYRQDHKVDIAAYKKEYRQNHRIERAIYERERRVNDIGFRLKAIIRNKIRQSIRDGRSYGHSIDLLGCSIEEVRKHIERQFKPGMSWDNWGVHGWHIDHIIPLAYFDFTDHEQQKRAFHYTNLQPLWAKDNMIKKARIMERQLILQ